MIADPEAAGRDKAEKFRDFHGLGDQPIGDLITVIEQLVGVDVAVLDVAIGEHGMTMHDPQTRVTIIAVAKTEHPMRQRSNLAHELAHVVFNDRGKPASTGAGWSDVDEVEARARAFARHLLLPANSVHAFPRPGKVPTESDLSWVVQRFIVSPEMATIALAERGLISAEVAERWRTLRTPDLATQFGWQDLYRLLQRDSATTRAPQRLLARAVRGYQEGVVGAHTIARLRGIDTDAIEQELQAAGIAPDTLDRPDGPPIAAGLTDAELDALLGGAPDETR